MHQMKRTKRAYNFYLNYIKHILNFKEKLKELFINA